MTSISLVDDESLFLSGLKEMLDQEDDLTIVGVYTKSEEFISSLNFPANYPDILIVDMKMPKINGIELTKKVVEKAPQIKVIGLSSHYSKVLIFQMLKIGAAAYLPKNTSLERLTRTIRRVHLQGFYFEDMILQSYHDNKLSNKVKKQHLNHGLTDREVEVIRLICQQCTNQDIAKRLFISLKTVERHRSNIFEKTEAKNVVGVVLFALKHQMIEHTFI